MPRPIQCRRVCQSPTCTSFKPAGMRPARKKGSYDETPSSDGSDMARGTMTATW